ncbi:MAG: transcription elongation factor GreB, partial [Pseudomonadota bacterium]|nr:transcription elongation factor GreB [Pseudomonadota bacterium]
MTRYRPPPPKSAPYVTPAGFEQLQEELRVLWKVERPEITRRVAEAAALGDRSENADYIYGKRRLGEIDRRVRYLSKRLDEVQIVDRLPDDTNRIFFGATIDIEREDGESLRYRIVGADEFDRQDHYISVDSPLAQQLLGKRKGDLISLSLDGHTTRYTIVAINYPSVADRRKNSSNAYNG